MEHLSLILSSLAVALSIVALAIFAAWKNPK